MPFARPRRRAGRRVTFASDLVALEWREVGYDTPQGSTDRDQGVVPMIRNELVFPPATVSRQRCNSRSAARLAGPVLSRFQPQIGVSSPAARGRSSGALEVLNLPAPGRRPILESLLQGVRSASKCCVSAAAYPTSAASAVGATIRFLVFFVELHPGYFSSSAARPIAGSPASCARCVCHSERVKAVVPVEERRSLAVVKLSRSGDRERPNGRR